MLIRHVAAACRVEVTKHGEQGRFVKGMTGEGVRAPDGEAASRNPQEGEPVTASKHK